jgi:hypothetical protein
VAQALYSPSYISLHSALSYHGWIPEAVYTTTSVSIERARVFHTCLGTFSYHRIPKFRFYQGVEHIRMNDTVFLMADPWKALADYIYIHKTHWHTRAELHEDLRIEY